jgi:hypothetical protein
MTRFPRRVKRTRRISWATGSGLGVSSRVRVFGHHINVVFISREDLRAAWLRKHGRLVIAIVFVLLRVEGPGRAAVYIVRLP